ncbi:MAG: alpha,alpha-trehalose-phosphate synthase (UDP-forming) [Gammaproteobacteria bacterium]|jgi:trehalose 6-phosphate synthase|nr:alpha,alpha-trehalose-phosphate synthase (UDP-forming) [Gammaproteobacteria bacterium]MBU0830119.1 alpha,alpha-trehalose-phosphate synthase (UDP-forming) [Gammaproteobacteria bacterium]MBU0890628.1 alpha,alpha-trehalose-phosphate synthase (UDP-forming) [Gammaproteobacteria bacterium]MBU1354397.1 alpha,alpha-trehalose-phosphate synthase (UDP-forming) [Gammaproteobacteria bacterium]MBU1507077.1 alpha,alpha-trehalose-phosphate synthase (UDP-forming) [Gammaproteobacteria bacterium]
MSRLVVISNRIADPRKPAAGGLAVALGEALNRTGGLWFGWSGTVVEDGTPGESDLHTRQAGAVTLATVDLCSEDHRSYYQGYSNSVLWPVFHYRLDLADFDASYIAGYRRVNQMFARKLLPLLRDDDIIWVHDYHLIPLAAELRAMGCKQRIGFFLHIPVPPPLIMAAIPQHEWLMRSLFAYDLVGLQSEADVSHFKRYVRNEGSAEELDDTRVRAFGATVVVKSFPIGIDVDEFTRLTHASDAMDTFESMRAEYSRRRLLMGIDRLDYSKGIPQRVRAFRELLDRYPENRDSATLIMIASPTRDDVNAYGDLRQELEGLCGSVNGDYGELDWMPVRYIHRMVARKRVPGLCRAAAVGLVTPLRDGMNLVAKEYVVAQDPEDPGVLVLSRFAGAAEQLKEALLVNPYDTQGMADSIQQALQMPLVERQARHQKLMARIREYDVHWWRKAFLNALQAAGE